MPCASPHFADEALFATAEPLLAFRDQHHPTARSRVRVAHHFHDHDAATREQHESHHSVEYRKKSARHFIASADDLDRSKRNDSAEQSRSEEHTSELQSPM